ncbi:MAG: AI-2E family transporter [Verrucomicrobia bacterium]|nr:AI-2E family transporter [Verrucomicrobiota bacterium]
MHNVPSVFQKRMIWTAVTALSIALLGTFLVGLIYLGTRVLAFLQPLLVPFAVAGVLAYLLEPLVLRLMKWNMSRHKAVLLVFSVATVIFAGGLLVVVPVAIKQGGQFIQVLPNYTKVAGQKISDWATSLNEHLRKDYGVDLLKTSAAKTPPAAPGTTTNVSNNETQPTPGSDDLQKVISGEWLEKELPALVNQVWYFIKSGLGGFLGMFGFLISLVIVPLYLYYFLTEAPKISESWQDYVPIRASRFKDEVVDTLTEINRYLIAFFRGQLVVSMINGLATAIGLSVLGLNFGWLIGLTLCFLGMVPYLGLSLCWITAVIIASVQGGSWMIAATHPWWVFPLAVTGVFSLVQQVDSFFISPRVVGGSVGLHPMTVIASVFAWSLILGGLLGAILAVPMTAAVKVLFQRYVWKRAMADGFEATV